MDYFGKKFWFTIISLLLVISPMAALAQADTFEKGLKGTASLTGLLTNDMDLNRLVGLSINFALSFLGILFMILVFYGGVVWFLAGGDPSGIKKAKSTIIHSAIGFVVVLVAYFLVQEVLSIISEGLK